MLLDYLRAFNRKERFLLVGRALGNPTFRLDAEFRKSLSTSLALDVPVDALCAMDYHLDWLYAALALSASDILSGVHPNEEHVVRGTPEDVDLLIAYQGTDAHHIITLEAKGAMGWTNKQMRSKARRLAQIFRDDGERWPGVVPHFVIASPVRPKYLQHGRWPAWMTPGGSVSWIELPWAGNLQTVSRCTADGQLSKVGEYWTTAPA